MINFNHLNHPNHSKSFVSYTYVKSQIGTLFSIEGETEEDNLQLVEVEKSASKLVGYPLKQPRKILKKIREEAKSAKIEIKKVTNISMMKGKELKNKLKEILSEISHAVGDKTARLGRISNNENYCGYLMSFACEYPCGVFIACEIASAMRKRLVVERSIGHAKGYHLMGKAIYRNYDMIKIQQVMSATAYNIEKLVRHSVK